MEKPPGATWAKPEQTPPASSRGSTAITGGIRVETHPVYLSEQSDPEGRQFVFGYRIVIANQSDQTVQVLARHWVIIDAEGNRRDVKGEGVVGQQPVIEPGESFEYASFCPMPTRWGTMEGEYTVQGETRTFRAAIGRFFFVCDE